jgi:ubiquinone/menaquinone biosynthesis C-methylase UbiE
VSRVGWPSASGGAGNQRPEGRHPATLLADVSSRRQPDDAPPGGPRRLIAPAEAAGEAPSVFADRQHAAIAANFERIGISFDHYTRTATPTHHQVVQEVFGRLHRRGLVYEATAESAWCPIEGRSLPDRYVEGICPACAAPDARGDQCDVCGRTLDPVDLGSPRCRRCGAAATFRPLRQLFLALDRLQPEVAAYVESASPGWRAFVAEETRGILRQGLRARAITRDLAWGVPVPLAGWEDRRLYVWFDAVIGYLSASREWAREAGRPQTWREWWADPDSLHRYFIGKDNLFFHTIFWPALLLGAGQGWKPPDEVVANHYLTLAGEQMSASRGHGFVPATAEAIRATFGRLARPSAWAVDPSPPVVGQAPEPPLQLTATGPAPARPAPPRRAFGTATVRAAYDTVAEDYTEAFGHDLDALPLDRAMLEHLVERTGTNGVVLDLGCGPAPAAGYLSELGAEAVGADLSTGMLRQARGLLLSLPLVQADMRRLPFRAAAFDGAVAYYCIQHVARSEIPAVVEEVGRVLGEAGAVLVATHLGQGEVVIEDFLDHRVEPLGGTLYGRDELAALLEAAGFYIEMEERRGPLAHEADTERIYLLARRR